MALTTAPLPRAEVRGGEDQGHVCVLLRALARPGRTASYLSPRHFRAVLAHRLFNKLRPRRPRRPGPRAERCAQVRRGRQRDAGPRRVPQALQGASAHRQRRRRAGVAGPGPLRHHQLPGRRRGSRVPALRADARRRRAASGVPRLHVHRGAAVHGDPQVKSARRRPPPPPPRWAFVLFLCVRLQLAPKRVIDTASALVHLGTPLRRPFSAQREPSTRASTSSITGSSVFPAQPPSAGARAHRPRGGHELTRAPRHRRPAPRGPR